MKYCSIKGCNSKQYAKRLCNKHYNQGRRNREFGINLNNCCVEGCKEVAISNKMCSLHYQRARKYVELNEGRVHKFANKGKICSEKGCFKPAKTRGLCRNCYTKQKREGGIEFVNVCRVEGCGKYVEGNGLCRSHYRKELYAMKNNQKELRPGDQKEKGAKCIFPECESSARTKELCTKHYDRFKYHRKTKNIESVKEYIENRDKLTRKYKNIQQ